MDRAAILERHLGEVDAERPQAAIMSRRGDGPTELAERAGDQELELAHRSIRLAPASRTRLAARNSDSNVPASVHQPASTSLVMLPRSM